MKATVSPKKISNMIFHQHSNASTYSTSYSDPNPKSSFGISLNQNAKFSEGSLQNPTTKVPNLLRHCSENRDLDMPSSANNNTTPTHSIYSYLLLVLLIVAFFPSFFHYLASLPASILSYPFGTSSSLSSPGKVVPTPPPLQQPTVNGHDNNNDNNNNNKMSWFQKQFALPSRSRGSYLITDEVVSQLPEIKNYKVGLLNLFVQHTSCALSLNENWDADVREDMSDALDRIAPESGRKGEDLYRHSAEGPDDMPVRSALARCCRPAAVY
jgi:thiamine phosphate synthase YjbQ (UPF0047 family)